MTRNLIVGVLSMAIVLLTYTIETKRTSTNAADAPAPQDMKRYENTGKVKVTRIITLGDHSYIRFAPRTVSSEDDDVIETEILIIKNKFEADHPELLVTGWQVHSEISMSRIEEFARYRGIWVDHKPSGKQPLTRDHVVPVPK